MTTLQAAGARVRVPNKRQRAYNETYRRRQGLTTLLTETGHGAEAQRDFLLLAIKYIARMNGPYSDFARAVLDRVSQLSYPSGNPGASDGIKPQDP